MTVCGVSDLFFSILCVTDSVAYCVSHYDNVCAAEAESIVFLVTIVMINK